MVKTINMLELRSKIGEVLDRTYYNKDYFLIRRGRRDLAAIIPLNDFDLIKNKPRYNEKELDEMAYNWVRADRITPSMAKKLNIPYKKSDVKEEKELKKSFKFFIRNRYGNH